MNDYMAPYGKRIKTLMALKKSPLLFVRFWCVSNRLVASGLATWEIDRRNPLAYWLKITPKGVNYLENFDENRKQYFREAMRRSRERRGHTT